MGEGHLCVGVALPHVGARSVGGCAATNGDERPATAQEQNPLLERWNGFDDGVSYALWGATGHNPFDVESYDEPGCAGSFAFGELRDSGMLFLRPDGSESPPVYFFDHDASPAVFPVSANFQSFLRDWMNLDMDLIGVVERARDRAERT